MSDQVQLLIERFRTASHVSTDFDEFTLDELRLIKQNSSGMDYYLAHIVINERERDEWGC